MTKRKSCVEPKIGKRIGEYNEDASLPAKAKRLSIEEKFMFEAHLIRCPFCRKRLSLRARMEFETMLILSGFFIEDPTLLEERRKLVKKFFKGKLTFEGFKGDWFKVSREEYKKIKSFMKKDC